MRSTYLVGDLNTKFLTRGEELGKGLIAAGSFVTAIITTRLVVYKHSLGEGESLDIWRSIRVDLNEGGGTDRCRRLVYFSKMVRFLFLESCRVNKLENRPRIDALSVLDRGWFVWEAAS